MRHLQFIALDFRSPLTVRFGIRTSVKYDDYPAGMYVIEPKMNDLHLSRSTQPFVLGRIEIAHAMGQVFINGIEVFAQIERLCLRPATEGPAPLLRSAGFTQELLGRLTAKVH